jgi:hypothetical protein
MPMALRFAPSQLTADPPRREPGTERKHNDPLFECGRSPIWFGIRVAWRSSTLGASGANDRSTLPSGQAVVGRAIDAHRPTTPSNVLVDREQPQVESDERVMLALPLRLVSQPEA